MINSFKEFLAESSFLSDDSAYHATDRELVKHKFIRLMFKPISRNLRYKQNSKISTHAEGKPNGFWYAYGDSWVEYQSSMGGTSGSIVYEIDFKSSKIIKLTSEKDLKSFTDNFKSKDEHEISGNFVDWDKVSKRYDGIELTRFDPKWSTYNTWMTYWDIPSGCLFNTSKIELKRIN